MYLGVVRILFHERMKNSNNCAKRKRGFYENVLQKKKAILLNGLLYHIKNQLIR